jgi:hypothetical protein
MVPAPGRATARQQTSAPGLKSGHLATKPPAQLTELKDKTYFPFDIIKRTKANTDNKSHFFVTIFAF